MARLRRFCPPDIPVHIIQRGINRSNCFYEDADKAYYFQLLKIAAEKFRADVHAWVFMSNHVHLLVTPLESTSISNMMQFVDREYVRFFNGKHARTGTLWNGRFKSCLVQTERYFLICQRYIELNPVRAGLVAHPGDFHWSTYKSNAEGLESSLLRPHPIYMSLGKTNEERQTEYRALFSIPIPRHEIENIRNAVNRGLVIGDEAFKRRIEIEGGQRVTIGKRGPRPRADAQA